MNDETEKHDESLRSLIEAVVNDEASARATSATGTTTARRRTGARRLAELCQLARIAKWLVPGQRRG